MLYLGIMLNCIRRGLFCVGIIMYILRHAGGEQGAFIPLRIATVGQSIGRYRKVFCKIRPRKGKRLT